MPCHLYILENTAGKYYVGVTHELERRLAEHNRGQNASTRGRGPWTMVYTELFGSSAEAKSREAEIKRKKRKSYLRWLVKNYGSVV